MSLWLGVVRRQAALDDPDSNLHKLYAELLEARNALLFRDAREPNAKPAERRWWPEHARVRQAEKNYKAEIRAVKAGGT